MLTDILLTDGTDQQIDWLVRLTDEQSYSNARNFKHGFIFICEFLIFCSINLKAEYPWINRPFFVEADFCDCGYNF